VQKGLGYGRHAMRWELGWPRRPSQVAGAPAARSVHHDPGATTWRGAAKGGVSSQEPGLPENAGLTSIGDG
jgi:hypothetical protein